SPYVPPVRCYAATFSQTLAFRSQAFLARTSSSQFRPRCCRAFLRFDYAINDSSSVRGERALRFQGVSLGGWLQRKFAGVAHYFPPKSVQLLYQFTLLWHSFFVERFPRLSDGHHKGKRPAAERANHEFHCVYRLQALHTSSRANEADHFVGQVGRM